MIATTPLWVDALTAAFLVAGGLAALIGSFGLARLGTFFQRVHAPTLGATVGTWCLVLATIAQTQSGQPLVPRGADRAVHRADCADHHHLPPPRGHLPGAAQAIRAAVASSTHVGWTLSCALRPG